MVLSTRDIDGHNGKGTPPFLVQHRAPRGIGANDPHEPNSPFDYSYTIEEGPNRFMIVAVFCKGNDLDPVNFSYGSHTVYDGPDYPDPDAGDVIKVFSTVAKAQGRSKRLVMWAIKNPTVGTNNIYFENEPSNTTYAHPGVIVANWTHADGLWYSEEYEDWNLHNAHAKNSNSSANQGFSGGISFDNYQARNYFIGTSSSLYNPNWYWNSPYLPAAEMLRNANKYGFAKTGVAHVNRSHAFHFSEWTPYAPEDWQDAVVPPLAGPGQMLYQFSVYDQDRMCEVHWSIKPYPYIEGGVGGEAYVDYNADGRPSVNARVDGQEVVDTTVSGDGLLTETVGGHKSLSGAVGGATRLSQVSSGQKFLDEKASAHAKLQHPVTGTTKIEDKVGGTIKIVERAVATKLLKIKVSESKADV